MSAKVITSANFAEEVLQAKGTVLLDFWAEWCGPCRMLSPIIDEVAASHPEVKVGKVNVDEQQALAQQFNIMSIPTLVVFKDGKKVNEAVGLMPKEQVESLLA
ncbi:thioredoxin [Selenomonas sp. KH1T6]|uniref:thioredoxin n=1 Tax=Selenomonas sp. KH1T6 TaxID=3158784 RepID=UPI0008A7D3F1|nr:thioredoxin [Selenomonas ruminantium]